MTISPTPAADQGHDVPNDARLRLGSVQSRGLHKKANHESAKDENTKKELSLRSCFRLSRFRDGILPIPFRLPPVG
jgi:hypothetical protein